ncbi:hypothetical protein [Streptomyces sp. CNZ748]|uniref:hypothetical protein n=2 Tax=unclassified Streptomyces TaxID=2593676 RepID=UPI001E62CF7A|nr:hypothetical protein [Streptomyces sp. CNZ748]
MGKMEALLVLAEAVSEGRITPDEFATVCLPLYKHYPYRYPSEEHYQAATELFYIADDYDSTGLGMPDLLNDDQVRQRAADVARRMRMLLR